MKASADAFLPLLAPSFFRPPSVFSSAFQLWDIWAGPITKNKDRGVYAEMWIEDPYSLGLVREGSGLPLTEQIGDLLETCLKAGKLPAPKLKLRRPRESQLWVSKFYL